MSNAVSLGGRVRILANDFVQMDTTAHISYMNESDRRFLLEIDCPLSIANVTYTHAIASPRLVKDGKSPRLVLGVMSCSIIWVSKDRFNSAKPTDITWWRGGAAAIADVVFEEQSNGPGSIVFESHNE